MKLITLTASVLSLTLSAYATAGNIWEGYNSRLLENSEVRDLSSEACLKLELSLHNKLVMLSNNNNENVFLYQSNGKYLNIHCFGIYNWVEIIPQEEFIRMKQEHDTMKQNEKDRIALELDGLL